MTTGFIDKIIVPSLRMFFRVLPFRTVLSLVYACPRLSYVLPPGKHLVSNTYLGKYTVDIDTTYPIERGMWGNCYEPELIWAIRYFTSPGDTCLDIGANVGAITVAMADAVGPSGKVYAFEPGPGIFDRLRRNIGLNPGLEKIVDMVNLGVSDRSGILYWNESVVWPGNASLLSPDGIEVNVVTIDEYFAAVDMSGLKFVKIDVEGMEYEVLKGGAETWGKYAPVIYFECLPHTNRDRGYDIMRKIGDLLAGLGYSLHKIDKNRRITLTSAGDLGLNTLAVPVGRPGNF